MGRWLVRVGVGACLVAAACVPQAPTAPPREAKDAPEPPAATTVPTTAAIASAPSPSSSSTSPPIAAGEVAAPPRPEPGAAPSVPADLLREPLFVAAEQKRQDAERLAPPVYRGDRNEKDMAAFLMPGGGGPWDAWHKAKRAAIEDAAAAYAKIPAMTPAPPPAWVVAVHARVGALWASFAAELRDIPMPDNLRQPYGWDVDWRNKFGMYGNELTRAAWEFQMCSQAGRRAHVAEEHVRFCEVWLAALTKPRPLSSGR